MLLVLLFFSASVNSQSKMKKAEAEIRQVLEQQQKDWNRGDIKAFMEGYWKSKELKFIGKSGVKNGWEVTLNSYLHGYPNKETMGQLSFEIIDINLLGKKNAIVVGKFVLRRATDEPSGYFSLHWQKIEGRWLIVMDHTSG